MAGHDRHHDRVIIVNVHVVVQIGEPQLDRRRRRPVLALVRHLRVRPGVGRLVQLGRRVVLVVDEHVELQELGRVDGDVLQHQRLIGLPLRRLVHLEPHHLLQLQREQSLRLGGLRPLHPVDPRLRRLPRRPVVEPGEVDPLVGVPHSQIVDAVLDGDADELAVLVVEEEGGVEVIWIVD